MKDKIINSLSYFSITFAPFLFPFIVWLLSASNPDIHKNAFKAFMLHLVPIIVSIIFLMSIGATGLITNDSAKTGFTSIILIGFVVLIDVGMYIYNIYLGIKTLMAD